LEQNTAQHPAQKIAIDKAHNEIEESRRQLEEKSEQFQLLQEERTRMVEEQDGCTPVSATRRATTTARSTRRHAISKAYPKIRSFTNARTMWEEDFANMLEHAYNEIAHKKNVLAEQRKEMEALQETSREKLSAELERWQRRYDRVSSFVVPREKVVHHRTSQELSAQTLAEAETFCTTWQCAFVDVFSQAPTTKMNKRRRLLIDILSRALWDSGKPVMLMPFLTQLYATEDDVRACKRSIVRLSDERHKFDTEENTNARADEDHPDEA